MHIFLFPYHILIYLVTLPSGFTNVSLKVHKVQKNDVQAEREYSLKDVTLSMKGNSTHRGNLLISFTLRLDPVTQDPTLAECTLLKNLSKQQN